MNKIFDVRMNDGSRHFADLPEIYPWTILSEHLTRLETAVETNYITDEVTEFWLDFEYKEQKFSVNNQIGEFWFFAENPDCPEEILLEVINHFGKLYQ
jgi:hypothetical protein